MNTFTQPIAHDLPVRIWGTQRRYSSEAILLALESHPYDSDEYIRDYQEFLEFRQAQE